MVKLIGRLFGVVGGFEMGRFARGFFDGAKAEAARHFTDNEVTLVTDLARTLDKCQPWTDHLDSTTINIVRGAIKRGNAEQARKVLTKAGEKADAWWCIDALKTTASW